MNKWRPCSERLPKHFGWYLVTVECQGILTVEFDQFYKNEGWLGFKDMVTAWMPLPKPYREVQE